jgi:hypothetical protein
MFSASCRFEMWESGDCSVFRKDDILYSMTLRAVAEMVDGCRFLFLEVRSLKMLRFSKSQFALKLRTCLD